MILLKLGSFVLQHAPEIWPVFRRLLREFCDCEGLDLGPEPPDWDRFHDVDRRIDEALKRK
jgi:hypothetical protein